MPQLVEQALADDWLRVKRQILMPGVEKGMAPLANGRSVHITAPSFSND